MAYYNGRYVNVKYTGDISAETLREEVANAITETVSGVNAVQLDGVSPIPHSIGVAIEPANVINQSEFFTINRYELKGETGKTYLLSCVFKEGVDLLNVSTSVAEDWIDESGEPRTLFHVFVPTILQRSIIIQDGHNYSWITDGANTIDIFESVSMVLADVSGVSIKSYGKNLFDLNYNLSDESLYEGEDKYGDVVKNEWRPPNSTSNSRMFFFELPENVNVNISVIRRVNTSDNISLKLYSRNKEGVYSSVETLASGTKTYSISVFTGNTTKFALWASSKGVLDSMRSADTVVQIEIGVTKTEYEEYKTPVDGAISISPTTTLVADTSGVSITATYNKDTNSVIQELKNAILNLGGTINV